MSNKSKIFDGKYALHSPLDEGATSIVYLAEDYTGKPVAIKIFKRYYINFRKEIEILSKFNSPYLIKFIDANEFLISNKKKLQYIALEYAEKGCLFDYLYYTKKGFSEDFAKAILFQLTKGLQEMYKHNISHRDIKPENIVIDTNFNLKIADFGFAENINKYGNGKLKSPKGTRCYGAPEILLNNSKEYDPMRPDKLKVFVIE